MLMTWSSRERNRSCSPLPRRSRGRIEPSANHMTAENHSLRFEGIPNRNLQENRPRRPNFRQFQSKEFQKFLLPVNRFRIFHGRLPTLIEARLVAGIVGNYAKHFSPNVIFLTLGSARWT